MISTLPNTNINFCDTFIFLSVDALNLDQSRISTFGKHLSFFEISLFKTTFNVEEVHVQYPGLELKW